MYKTPGCEIPGVGRVEMAWVKNAPVAASTPTPSSNVATGNGHSGPVKGDMSGKDGNGGADVHMGDDDGAAAGGNGYGGDRDGERAEQNLDYDVADDEWS